MKKYILSFYCLSLFLISHAGYGSGKTDSLLVMQFGKNSSIVYDLRTGTFDVFQDKRKIIAAARAAGKNGQSLYTSIDYTSRKYNQTAFSDALGKGIKYSIESGAEGMPLMHQVFYTYLSRNYFFTEFYLEGQGLNSNYMAPLISGDVNIFATEDNRMLFIPFDNDTFISYNAKSMSSSQSNTSAEAGVVYENKSRNGLITGSVEHTTWKTGVRTRGAGSRLSELSVWGGYSEAAVTRDTLPHGSVTGNSIKSPKIFVGYFADWRRGLEEFGRANRKLEKPYVYNWSRPTPLGWNSWGVMQDHITYDKAIAVADFFSDSLPAFRTGNTAFIDLDSYWDRFLKGGINGDIVKLKQFAAYCKSKGLQPGIYWAPFTDWGWNYNGSGKRTVEGATGYTYEDIWTRTAGHYHNIDGGRAIDPTHPGTRQRIALFISKFKACGFKMIKIDFLGHGAVEADRFYDTTVTTGMQAYRKGMEYLVDQLGDDFLIYAAISPSLATGRYVHMRRIACDAFKSINDTRYTLNSVNYGWWQTYVYNYIDADHIVFGNESAGANRARLVSGLITGSLITGDDYSVKGPWIARAKALLQNKEIGKLVKNGVAFRPVEGNSGDSANELYELSIGNDHYLAVFNFSDNDKAYTIDIGRIGLGRNRYYNLVEIFSNKELKAKTVLNCTIGKTDAAIYKFSSLPSFGQKNLRLWYEKPAKVWEETLPLGNGRLGMMPDGGIMKEKIVLNDITLWSGAFQDANNYNAYKQLPQIRQLLSEGKNDEAQALIDKDFVCTGQGSGGANWGCYQTLANLEIAFDYGKESKPINYKRELSLQNAMARCSYEINDVMYTREYFTSFGDDVNVIRVTANKPGMLNCRIGINREERATVKTEGMELQLSGQLDNGIDGKGMQYTAKVKTRIIGGSLGVAGNELVIKNATEVIIYVSAATDFRSRAYMEQAEKLLNTSMQKPYELQKKNHIAAFQKLFNRVSLSLGTTNADNLPTDERLVAFHKNPDADNGLAALFYQFGRYLSISSTRVGLLPPNLQGLWANQVHTPWNGDYHLDINVQMNHWPVEAANLSELNLPLAALVKGLVKNGEKTAKAYYNADGWVAHVITNVWRFTEPGESASWGVSKSGSGWLCNNLWEHYAFTNDKKYLQDIYPVLKGAAQFYNSILIKDDKTGWLVTSPSSSPENSFYLPNGRQASICIGAAFDNQIIRELFTNVITASQQLGVDAILRKELQDKLAQVPPAVIVSKDGRVQEWLEDYKETDPRHRHISHLYGLYPASLISPEATPEWAVAAKKTLEARGDDGPGWSIAYKLLFWARLKEGNRAYKLFTEIMKPTIRTDINYGAGGGIYPNLLSAGPPFQIDGNFGTTAGISEMLIQSHAGYIDLLPAIPDNWKISGEVKGLKARGNFTVDFKWKNGSITDYIIRSTVPRKVKIRVNGMLKEVITGTPS